MRIRFTAEVGPVYISLALVPPRLSTYWGNWGDVISSDIRPRWCPDDSLPWRWRRDEGGHPTNDSEAIDDDDDIPF